MNEVKRFRETPIGFKVIDLEKAIRWDPSKSLAQLLKQVWYRSAVPSWLDRAEIGTDDSRTGIFTSGAPY